MNWEKLIKEKGFFKGELQQNFVVMNKTGAGGAPRVVADINAGVSDSNTGTPRKHLMEVGPSGSHTGP
jgi:hypothetical protein